jgi:UDP-glucuronate 4-epimerase
MNKNVLVTGCAGFIGLHIAKKLLDNGFTVVGIDNLNTYYSRKLKIDRLKFLKKNINFKFFKIDLKDFNKLNKLVNNYDFDIIIHLAAQAGVRYSLENPQSYIQSNIVGIVNLLESLKNKKIQGLFFASSSSVYGRNKKMPYKEIYNTDEPKSLYAATKKSGEVILNYYSFYFNIPIVCLRFFTVYGPWGRPDMALFKFINLIKKKKKIELYNYGNMTRSFTYIDDLVLSIYKLINNKSIFKIKKFLIINIGGEKKISLKFFLKKIEKYLNLKAKIKFSNMMKADVTETYSSNIKLKKIIGFEPKTSLDYGIKKFVDWYNNYKFKE